MNVLLDTSALLKLYCEEADSATVTDIITRSDLTNIYLSEIAKLEFASALWKKARMKEMRLEDATEVLQIFEDDLHRYLIVPVTTLLLETAKNLITKYRVEGLRTLDSIQLATCVALKAEVDLFLTSDKLLNILLQKEGLPTEISPSPNL